MPGLLKEQKIREQRGRMVNNRNIVKTIDGFTVQLRRITYAFISNLEHYSN